MHGLRKWAWAVLAAAAAAAPAVAQTSSSSSSTFSGSSGASGASNTGSSSGLGSNSGGTGSNSGGQQGGSALMGLQDAPSLTAPTGTASSSLSTSNSFSGYYANPYYQGRITAGTNATPGGFGTALYPNSSTGTGSVNRTTGRTGANSQNSSQISGIVVPIQVQINYSAQVRFSAPPVPAARLQSEIRGAIDGSISNPKSVQVITDANNNIVLRGSVKDEEEARLVEGLVRITPGVGAITNELAVAAPAAGVAAAGK